ncbi:MAG: SMC-Scp complex subunit ScpB [Anaerolineae bacterium]|nr:SMC-Scp complex subunit ScpB [Anaerolineae bacterium]
MPALVECLLFVAPEPVTVSNLAASLDVSVELVEAALGQLAVRLSQGGLRLQRSQSRVQLVTAPEAAAAVERFLGLNPTTRLSPAALETLAIIAYRQPITRAQIDELRGVNSDGVLRTLLHWGLVEQGERLEQAGRPFQYGTTPDFLRYFGLQSLSELPPLTEDGAEATPLQPSGQLNI